MPALPALPAGAQTVVDKLSSVWDKAAPHLKASGPVAARPAAAQLHPSPWAPAIDGRSLLVDGAPAGRVQKRVGCRHRRRRCRLVPPSPLLACSHTSALLQTALHWGYIPAIILLGMTQTEPRPSWGQLLGPM